MAESKLKSFFHEYMTKIKRTPTFTITITGPKHRQRFLCELTIDGYDYTATGNSTTKKEAQRNACNDFLQYFVRIGEVSGDQYNALMQTSSVAAAATGVSDTAPPQPVAAAVDGTQSGVVTPISRPVHSAPDATRFADLDHSASALMKHAQEQINDQETSDANSSIHGNWTIDNAKGKLHQFLQMNKIEADYKYSSSGPGFHKSFTATMTIYVKKINRSLHGMEQASTKQNASKMCALSLVRQLYHLGVVDAYAGSIKQRAANGNVIKPMDFQLDSDVLLKLEETVECLALSVPAHQSTETGAAVLLEDKRIKQLNAVRCAQKAERGTVSWAPPQVNWNPWSACNIDEGYYANTPLDAISRQLCLTHQQNRAENTALHNMMLERGRLPIHRYAEDIVRTTCDHQVVLIKGNTGCGKTTQVCQYILDHHISAGCGANCTIVVTQPRRISAISLAERVASERAESLGESVGFSVRFESTQPRPYASILFCTVGLLLRKLETGLKGISHIIVDEIHERDLNTDFLLIVLRDMIRHNADLRVIIMSATVDTQLFTDYFDDIKLFEIEGKLFDVQEYFLEDCIKLTNFQAELCSRKRKFDQLDKDVVDEDSSEPNLNLVIDSDLYDNNVKQVMSQLSEKELCFELFVEVLKYCDSLDVKGSVLVFLPGWNCILSLFKFLKCHPIYGTDKYLILPLHSQIPREDQKKVFQPVNPNVTKIILATNIAESSITINDVVFVVNFGKCKQKQFNSTTNMTVYSTVWTSRSSFEQRKGRAGRLRAGHCFHLCSRARHRALCEHVTPEMLRTPLHELALTIHLLRLGDVTELLARALQPPPLDAVVEAECLLLELDCLQCTAPLSPPSHPATPASGGPTSASQCRLTELGRLLARLPIEPRLARALVLACFFRLGDAMCAIAALASVSDIFMSLGAHVNRSLSSWNFRKYFAGPHCSDHLTYLNAFFNWRRLADSRNELHQVYFCDRNNLSQPLLYVANEASRQLRSILVQTGFPELCFEPVPLHFDSCKDLNLDLLVSLVSMAFYPNVCYHVDKRKVYTIGSRVALFNKSSINFSRYPVKFDSPLFVFSEKIRTRAVSCNQLTMTNATNLLLYASRRVECVPADQSAAPEAPQHRALVLLDGWLPLTMSSRVAALLVSWRACLGDFIRQLARDPELCDPGTCEAGAEEEGARDRTQQQAQAVARLVPLLSRQTHLSGSMHNRTPAAAGGVWSTRARARGATGYGRGGFRGVQNCFPLPSQLYHISLNSHAPRTSFMPFR